MVQPQTFVIPDQHSIARDLSYSYLYKDSYWKQSVSKKEQQLNGIKVNFHHYKIDKLKDINKMEF